MTEVPRKVKVSWHDLSGTERGSLAVLYIFTVVIFAWYSDYPRYFVVREVK